MWKLLLFVAACGFSPHAAVDGGGSADGMTGGTRHRKQLTLAVGSPTMLDDFVASVITVDPDLATYARDPGQIAFTDLDGTPLSREIVAYDPSVGALEAWVRIPHVADSIDLYMTYGPGEPAEPAQVWNGYVAAWHFAEATGPWVDTVAARSVTAPTAPEMPTPTSMGIAGTALSFDGATGTEGDYTTTGAHDPTLDFGTTSFTMQAWVHVDMSANGYDEVLFNGGDNSAGYALSLGGSNWLASVSDGFDRFASFGMESAMLHHWNQLTATVDRTNELLTLYLNGKYVTQVTTDTMGAVTSAGALEIGRGVQGRQFEGTVDEVRLATGAYTLDRIAAEYRNLTMRPAFQHFAEDQTF